MHRENRSRHSKSKRQQSAIEYLVTYSWMFVILVIVIAVLYVYGVIGGVTSTSNTCLPFPGFSCTTPTLNTSGYLSTEIGQQGTQPIYVLGTACNSNSTTPSNFIAASGLATWLGPNGAPIQYLFKCPVQGSSIGTAFRGNLWFEFDTGPGSGISTERVGTVQALINTQATLWNSFSYIVYNPQCLDNTADIAIYTQSTVLTCTIEAYDIFVDTAVTLTTNSYSLLAYNSLSAASGSTIASSLSTPGTGTGAYGMYLQGNSVNLLGAVTADGSTGTPASPSICGADTPHAYGPGGGGGGGAILVASASNPVINSYTVYFGQGAAYVYAGPNGNVIAGANGFNTIAAGGIGSNMNLCVYQMTCFGQAGGTPSAPSQSTLSTSILSWYSAGIQNYLEGGAGGGATAGGAFYDSYGGSGGGEGIVYGFGPGNGCYAGGEGGYGQLITYVYTGGNPPVPLPNP